MRKYLIVLAMLFGVSTSALANHIDSAKVIPSCNGYQISLTASILNPGTNYTITWTINGYSAPQAGSVSFTAASSTYSTTISEPSPPASSVISFSGTATLVGQNSVNISFAPTSLNCSPTGPLKIINLMDPTELTEVFFTVPSPLSTVAFPLTTYRYQTQYFGPIANEMPCLRDVRVQMNSSTGQTATVLAPTQMNVCTQNTITLTGELPIGPGGGGVVFTFSTTAPPAPPAPKPPCSGPGC